MRVRDRRYHLVAMKVVAMKAEATEGSGADERGGRGAALPTFEQLARMPDAEIDVELGAALIARDASDRVNVREVLDELSSLGAPLAHAGVDERSMSERVAAVSERFASLGFHGNRDDYYDPKNSLLPDVLSKKTGIPITLSIVWSAIARRAGLVANGVAFPGHYLVRVEPEPGPPRPEEPAQPIVVDPFAAGRIVDDDAAKFLLRRALGTGAELHASLFAPASSRVTLVRLLTNLESTWAKRGEHARAFLAVDRIVTLIPDSARMLRERAALALRIGATEIARSDLERVLELEPHAPDAAHIEARLATLASAPKTTLH
jgi:regulator of sirC expression with transglutaminase-like and TPR domain